MAGKGKAGKDRQEASMGDEGISFASVFQAKAFIARELKKSENKFAAEVRSCEVDKRHREMTFDKRELDDLLIKGLLDGSSGLVTGRYLKMGMEMTKAAEVLDASTKFFDDRIARYTKTAEQAVTRMKDMAGQLAEHENRLSEALQRLSKTLGDPAMAAALENAKQLSTALSLLEQMEPGGALERVVKALSASGKGCEANAPHPDL